MERPRPAYELVGVRGAARHRRKTGDAAMEARAGCRKIKSRYTLTHIPPRSARRRPKNLAKLLRRATLEGSFGRAFRKFVAYYRVSTDKQGQSGLGLDAQRQAVMTYLNGGTWKLVAEHTEVEGGKRNARPGHCDFVIHIGGSELVSSVSSSPWAPGMFLIV
jgi:resolvase-like protein